MTVGLVIAVRLHMVVEERLERSPCVPGVVRIVTDSRI